ncbi:helix-turn-helix transcriptional regulator [Vagococcus carniphilus]|uniref:helix-turn-helix domain-containing protein n=1 Tax=Vagococcus carniphilus TaxID=218144 RepID=UPI0028912F28|nr:helix-turn-helix transcriptional regulator [Vagococcus carniphilus]MDT2832260.1 helix-turn-helix transcriptional regulator [Vagococcus carniphilus]MDT2840746.1 helix-turn-helix transcriptional regulator [Vagococcus carniphilus]MDT2855733.1 helix-turn-helix transcriptional regulator [Vagococcus carniphilus]
MNRMKELRLKEGLTLKELSDSLNKKYQINISDGQLSNYENGKRNPRDNKVWEQIADFFEVPVFYLKGITEEEIEEIEIFIRNLKNKH